MIAIKIKFESNRYNATPWGNNVNENIPEWPPSIYRLYRAMIDSWKRRYEYPEEKIVKLFTTLTEYNPCYKIPEYTSSYIVSYMDTKTNLDLADNESALIYNPFIYVTDYLYIVYNVDLDNESKTILNQLLSGINFLGRSESWVTISLTDQDIECNLIPSKMGDFYVPVATRVDNKWLSNMVKLTSDTAKSNLPETMKIVRYEFIRTINKKQHMNSSNKTQIKSVLYELTSIALPSIYDTLTLSEKVHSLLLSKSRLLKVKNFEKFSGRKDDGTVLKGNRHIYIMPLDINNDGRIDHILLKGRENLNVEEINVINSIHAIYQKSGKIQVTPIQYYSENDCLINKMKSKYWLSETPVVFSRHFKKNKGSYYDWMYGELIRELKFHSIITNDDEIEKIELIKNISKRERNYYWLNYKRTRKNDTERMGYGFKLTFKNKISCPFSVGYASHYGLGLFMPVGDDND